MKYLSIVFLSWFLMISCNKKNEKSDNKSKVVKSSTKIQVKSKKQNKNEKSIKSSKSKISKIKPPKKNNQKITQKNSVQAKIKVPANAIEVKKPVYYKTFKQNNNTYYVFYTAKIQKTAKIKGYAAPIPLEIVFDSKANIINIEILKNKETPEFIQNIKKIWLPKLYKITSNKPIIGKGGVDALSESTLSTEAIKKSVSIVRSILLSKILKQSPVSKASKKTK